MLLALAAAFAMSQAFRTVAAILATPLQAEFHLSPQQLGTFAGSFHFAFGAMQLFVGIGIDLHGVRRTILTGFPLAIAGAALSAVAPSYGTLVLGQVLIGVGCARPSWCAPCSSRGTLPPSDSPRSPVPSQHRRNRAAGHRHALGLAGRGDLLADGLLGAGGLLRGSVVADCMEGA